MGLTKVYKGIKMTIKKIGYTALMVVIAIGITACNNDKDREVKEEGEILKVSEQLTLECGVPIVFKGVGLNSTTLVTVEYNNTTEEYNEEFGVDIQYVAVVDCPPEPVVDVGVVQPVNGICPVGYELSKDCSTACTPVVVVEPELVTCGEGTELDEESNSCLVAEKDLECGEGTELDEESNTCVPAEEEEEDK